MACLHKKKLWDNRWCPVTCFYCTGEQERTCKHNKATNADRIRAMSDEELQFFFEDIYANGWYDATANISDNRVDWERWLQQPAEDESDL